jgi:hypothetical protein
MRNYYRGTPIDASYYDSVHLAELFQRIRLKGKQLTTDGHQMEAKAHISFSKGS